MMNNKTNFVFLLQILNDSLIIFLLPLNTPFKNAKIFTFCFYIFPYTAQKSQV